MSAEMPAAFDPDTCGFAVFATQGGGLARMVGETYVFVEAPEDVPGLGVGDTVPQEWGIVPINREARNEDEGLFDLRELDIAGLPEHL